MAFMNQDDSTQSGSAGAFQQGFAAAQNKNKAGKAKSTLRKAQKMGGGGLQTSTPSLNIPLAKRGGRVTKTGLVVVHKGEDIIPAKRSSKKTSRKRTTTIK